MLLRNLIQNDDTTVFLLQLIKSIIVKDVKRWRSVSWDNITQYSLRNSWKWTRLKDCSMEQEKTNEK